MVDWYPPELRHNVNGYLVSARTPAQFQQLSDLWREEERDKKQGPCTPHTHTHTFKLLFCSPRPDTNA